MIDWLIEVISRWLDYWTSSQQSWEFKWTTCWVPLVKDWSTCGQRRRRNIRFTNDVNRGDGEAYRSVSQSMMIERTRKPRRLCHILFAELWWSHSVCMAVWLSRHNCCYKHSKSSTTPLCLLLMDPSITPLAGLTLHSSCFPSAYSPS